MKYEITPVAKPRMTQSDKWKKRPAVLAYRAFKDECRYRGVVKDFEFSDRLRIVFYIPMPKSWSKKKKEWSNNTPHRQRPDIDNLVKALLDAVNEEDSHVWEIHARKVWSYDGSIEITEITDANSNC